MTHAPSAAQVAQRNAVARKLLALFYDAYAEHGSRNFAIRPDQPLLTELDVDRQAYVAAMNRLVDRGLLKLSGAAHGASLTEYGVEVWEDPDQLEQILPIPRISAEQFRRLVVRAHLEAYERATTGAAAPDGDLTIRERVLKEAGPTAQDYHFDEALKWIAAKRWITLGTSGEIVFNAAHVSEMRAYVDPLPADEPADEPRAAEASAMRVVMLSSSPDDPGLDRLALDTEFNRLRQKFEASEAGRRVTLDYWPDVRVDQLPDRLLEAPADILHFSGHSTEDGSITMRAHDGRILGLNPAGVAQIIGAFSDQLRCVVLVACFSDELAQRLREQIDVVVAMQSEVDDDAAIEFVCTFYNALARGHHVHRAFTVAAGLMRAHGELTGEPILYTRDGVDATTMHIGRSS